MPHTDAAERLIKTLGLEPLPGEGGFFRQTWRSDTASAIFFLLTRDDFSALHRLAQDEIWHFYAGDCVQHVQLNPRDGAARIVRMGPDVLAGDQPQVHVPTGVWQGARLAADQLSDLTSNDQRPEPGAGSPPNLQHGFALLGCTVSPPWDERGFALGQREALTRAFPKYATWIKALTR